MSAVVEAQAAVQERARSAITAGWGWVSTCIALFGATLLATGAMKVAEIYALWTIGNALGFAYGLYIKEKPIIVINAVYLVLNVVGIAHWFLGMGVR